MKPIIIAILVAAFGVLLCHGAPAPPPAETVVAVPAEEIPLQNVKNIQFNVARVLDHSLSTITFGDFMQSLSDSLDRRVKPLLAGWGKFSLKDLLVELARRKQNLIAQVQTKSNALLSNVHRKGSAFINDAHLKTDVILANVHDKGEELLSKKKQIIAEVQDKGEELLLKKKQVIHSVQDKGEQLLAKKKQVIANVHDKGEELLAKKKQILSDVHHKGEHFIEEVVEEVKQKVAEIKAHHDQHRRKREAAEEQMETLADLLEKEDELRDMNEVDTKSLNDFDALDIKFPTSFKVKPPVKPVFEEEYYTLPELARLVFNWARHNLSLRRLLRPSVISA